MMGPKAPVSNPSADKVFPFLSLWKSLELMHVRDFLHLSVLPASLQLVFQTLISAQIGFLIGAWQPRGLQY